MIARPRNWVGLSQKLGRNVLFYAIPCPRNWDILRSHGVVVGARAALALDTHCTLLGSAAQARPHGESLKAVRVTTFRPITFLSHFSTSLPRSGRKSGSETTNAASPHAMLLAGISTLSKRAISKSAFLQRFFSDQATAQQMVPIPPFSFGGGTDAPRYLSTHTGGLPNG